MKKIIYFPLVILSMGALIACSTHRRHSHHDNHYGASCSNDEDHGRNDITLLDYQGQKIYSYQNYYFAQIPPQQLADFIKDKSILILVDLRLQDANADLTSDFPAVYWHHAMEDLKSLDIKKYNTLEEHLDTFANKSIIFVSSEGDVATAAFVQYWADSHALNDNWMNKTSAALGLKDVAWLNKISAFLNPPAGGDKPKAAVSSKEKKRSAASEQ